MSVKTVALIGKLAARLVKHTAIGVLQGQLPRSRQANVGEMAGQQNLQDLLAVRQMAQGSRTRKCRTPATSVPMKESASG